MNGFNTGVALTGEQLERSKALLKQLYTPARNPRKSYKPLTYPSIFGRVWRLYLYNAAFTALFFWLFWGNFTIDDLAYEIDYFTLWGFADLRLNLFLVCTSFFFMFRQFFKDVNLIRFTFLMRKHDKEVTESGGNKRLYDGVEGSGKTMTNANDTLFIACKKDVAMRLAYYLKYPYKDDLEDDKDYKVLCESFDFYRDHADEYIPHLMADFDITYKGRKNYQWSMDFLDQKKRPAEGFAVAITEIANKLPNAWSRVPGDEKKDTHNMKVKSETLSLTRQWYDMTIIGDEQRAGEVVLAFRSVCSQTRHLLGWKKVLSPKFLELILSALKSRILKKKEDNTRLCSFLYVRLERLVNRMGFRVISYQNKEAITDKADEKEACFVLSCDLPFVYDTRYERLNYKDYGKSPDFVDKVKRS